MHPEAMCLSLFLLRLSSEVSYGLALLIPDTVDEKQALYTGRLSASKAALSAPSLTVFSHFKIPTQQVGCLSWYS